MIPSNYYNVITTVTTNTILNRSYQEEIVWFIQPHKLNQNSIIYYFIYCFWYTSIFILKNPTNVLFQGISVFYGCASSLVRYTSKIFMRRMCGAQATLMSHIRCMTNAYYIVCSILYIFNMYLPIINTA